MTAQIDAPLMIGGRALPAGGGTGSYDPAVVRRFWAKVETTTGDGCWTWTACRDRKGYGRFCAGKGVGTIFAHRFSLAVFMGVPLREIGPVVLHTCDNPPCVNPGHLRAGTQAENLADMVAKGRSRSQNSWVEGLCRRGHNVAETGIYIQPSTGSRQCHRCKLDGLADYKAGRSR